MTQPAALGPNPPEVVVLRKENAGFAVTIAAVRLVNGVITSKTVSIPADKDSAEIVLTVSKDAKPGLRQDVIVNGLMRTSNQTIVRYTRAIPVRVVEP